MAQRALQFPTKKSGLQQTHFFNLRQLFCMLRPLLRSEVGDLIA